MQAKAVRFLQDVVGDPDRAEEFEAMSPEEYAEHKRIEIENPFSDRARSSQRRMHMARRPTYAQLEGRVAELEEENQSLSDKLDSISDIVEEEEDEDEEDDEDQD